MVASRASVLLGAEGARAEHSICIHDVGGWVWVGGRVGALVGERVCESVGVGGWAGVWVGVCGWVQSERAREATSTNSVKGGCRARGRVGAAVGGRGWARSERGDLDELGEAQLAVHGLEGAAQRREVVGRQHGHHLIRVVQPGPVMVKHQEWSNTKSVWCSPVLCQLQR